MRGIRCGRGGGGEGIGVLFLVGDGLSDIGRRRAGAVMTVGKRSINGYRTDAVVSRDREHGLGSVSHGHCAAIGDGHRRPGGAFQSHFAMIGRGVPCCNKRIIVVLDSTGVIAKIGQIPKQRPPGSFTDIKKLEPLVLRIRVDGDIDCSIDDVRPDSSQGEGTSGGDKIAGAGGPGAGSPVHGLALMSRLDGRTDGCRREGQHRGCAGGFRHCDCPTEVDGIFLVDVDGDRGLGRGRGHVARGGGDDHLEGFGRFHQPIGKERHRDGLALLTWSKAQRGGGLVVINPAPLGRHRSGGDREGHRIGRCHLLVQIDGEGGIGALGGGHGRAGKRRGILVAIAGDGHSSGGGRAGDIAGGGGDGHGEGFVRLDQGVIADRHRDILVLLAWGKGQGRGGRGEVGARGGRAVGGGQAEGHRVARGYRLIQADCQVGIARILGDADIGQGRHRVLVVVGDGAADTLRCPVGAA